MKPPSEPEATPAPVNPLAGLDQSVSDFSYDVKYDYDAGTGLTPATIDYIVPDYVHVMWDGRIVKSGDKSLALELEAKGYDWVKELAVPAK